MRAYLPLQRIILCVALCALARGPVYAQTEGPQLTRAPTVVQAVEPAYPEAELETRRTAAVTLAITISETGTVEEAVVHESAGPDGAAFDQAALEAGRSLVFTPAEVDGKPARIQILYRFDFVPPEAAATHAQFKGQVKDRNRNLGIAGVEVKLSTGQSAITDAQGNFELTEIEPGDHTVMLQGPGLPPLQTQETFVAGQALGATYEVELEQDKPQDDGPSDDLEIVVTAPPLRKQIVSTEVRAEQAVRVPGTQGDVLRVVENLPGVARGALGSGQLIVWGSEPQDTRVYVDGVPVPRLYHDGGLRSIMSSDFVRSVDLVAGGYGAAFGRGLGGLVTIDTGDGGFERTKGNIALDVLDAQASVQTPIAPKLSAAVAARRGHLADLLSGTLRDDIEDYVPIPRYYDGQARVHYKLTDSQSLELTGLLSSDRLSRASIGADPTRSVREVREIDFQRLYLRYQVRTSSSEALTLTPYIGWDSQRLLNEFGPVVTDLNRRSTLGGLRASYRKRPFPWLTAEVGLDAELGTHKMRRTGSVGAPPREGDVRVFGQTPPDRISADTWQSTWIGVAPYVELDAALFNDTLHVIPGLRLDPYVSMVDERTPAEGDAPPIGISTYRFGAEPRLSLRQAVTEKFAIKGAWGVYRQPTQPDDLSATFGNPSLINARGMHWVLGLAYQPLPGLSAEITGFYSSSDELPARSPLSAPLAGQALLPRGEGRAYGQQLLIRGEVGERFFGWLSYSLVRSQRRAGSSGDYRLSDYDQTHVLTMLASYNLGAGFEVGARMRYATGFPRTPVTDAYFDVRRDRYQPVFGAQNSLRIPAFFALDVRASKRFDIGNTQLDIYVEVQNVTNHENAEEIVYSPDFSERGYVTGLPILPIAGLKWTL